jgi:DNA-directed RNA polymerase subunit K/omega
MDEKYGDEDFEAFNRPATELFKPNFVVRKEDDEDEDAKSESGSETSQSDNESGEGSDSDEDSDNEEEPKHIFIKSNEPAVQNLYPVSDDDDDEEDEEDENYLQKFDESLKQSVITDCHPEMQQHNYDEIESLSIITKDHLGVIIDPLHKTLPFLTKYEKARVLGERAKQINAGAAPFIKVDNNVIDGYLIALSELEQKAIPFILKRPLPNGGCEYWKLRDLEILV